MANAKIVSLEKRIDLLEDQVFGANDKDNDYPKDKEPCIDALANINGQIFSAVKGRPKIESVLKRVKELERFLDPDYVEGLTSSPAAKADIIIAEEDHVRKQADNLEKIQNLTQVLDSEHLKVVPALSNKFQELHKVQVNQQDKTGELTEEVKQMLLHYNNAITLLSKEFVQLNELLTRYEISAKPRKVIE